MATKELGQRIRQARERRGWNQTQLAVRLNKEQTTVSAWERDKNHPSLDDIKMIASLSFLIPETGPTARMVPLVGLVGAGELITMLPESAITYVDGPPETEGEFEALEVRGTSGMPVYREKDIVYYRKNVHHEPSDLIGEDVVVELATGEMYLKILQYGSQPGRYTLLAYNGASIPDVSIVRIAPVAWLKRRRK